MQSKQEQITELLELNEELENYFYNTIIPQLFVDSALLLRKYTPPAMKQFNLSEAHIGKPIADVTENLRYPTIIENIKTVIKTGEILAKEIQTTDMCWYQMNIIPYIIKSKNTTNGVIITFVDITPRILDLKDQEKLIIEHELLLDTIAHDIKNPITAFGLSIKLFKKLSAVQKDMLKTLVGNLELSLLTMQKVVDELTETRFQNHKYQAPAELLSIENLIEDVRLTLASQIFERNAVLKLDLKHTQISFNRRKFRSVLYNLINNAIKYTPEDRNPEITITSRAKKGTFVLEVSDNGIGINKSDYKSIFEKFGRIKDEVEGMGIGLYLVKSIITSVGGKISVKSKIGEGSSFKITLIDDTAE
ncbi:ATP-binding protein [Pedobacter lithocola]|uniref:histidine kinase n=1 Tax=Pedobacter lithocola TaxID=1908239 RepID=A0ABV8PAA0_9SPHI